MSGMKVEPVPVEEQPSEATGVRRVNPDRWVGLDVTRAVAMLGVVTMNWLYYLNPGGLTGAPDRVLGLLDVFDGPFATRFAATFVTCAGVGVSLMTRRAATGSPGERRTARLRLVRRGLALYVTGLVFGWIWPGEILHYYGLYLTVGAAIVFAPAAVVLGVAAIAFGVNVLVRLNQEGFVDPDIGSPDGLLADWFVWGTHPLTPWLVFFCVGMLLGRLDVRSLQVRMLALIGAMSSIGIGVLLSLLATDGSSEVQLRLWSDGAGAYGVPYTFITAGTSVAAIVVISTLAETTRSAALVRWLAAAGRTTLSIYLVHGLVMWAFVEYAVDATDYGVGTSLVAIVGYWLVAVAAAAWWSTRSPLGPAERALRAVGG
jgi:uncharacterized protein